MNPWRKRRRQLLRRQNEGSYTERMIRLADLGITVTVGPLTPEQRASRMAPPVLISVQSEFLRRMAAESDAAFQRAFGFDFTKPRPRLHDASEFYTLDTP